MYSATSTNTNNFVSISIRQVSFTLDSMTFEDADKVLDLIGKVDHQATFRSISSDDSGITYQFDFTYQEETQTKEFRRLLFRLKLEYPDMDFGEWGY